MDVLTKATTPVVQNHQSIVNNEKLLPICYSKWKLKNPPAFLTFVANVLQLKVFSLGPYYYDPNARQMSKAPVNQSLNVASKSTPGKIINKVEM